MKPGIQRHPLGVAAGPQRAARGVRGGGRGGSRVRDVRRTGGHGNAVLRQEQKSEHLPAPAGPESGQRCYF